jgi:ribonuclease HII
MKDFFYKDTLEAGIDECSQGALNGPIFVGCVILPQSDEIKNDFYWQQIKDSKKLSNQKRFLLEKYIKEIAIDYCVIQGSVKDIDKYNILETKIRTMHKALDNITKPEHILVDGDKFRSYMDETGIYTHTLIIQGDNKYKSIAAASILAKCEQVRYMEKLAISYPEYGFDKHHGYGTKQHIDAIRKYGYIENEHRKSFKIKSL